MRDPLSRAVLPGAVPLLAAALILGSFLTACGVRDGGAPGPEATGAEAETPTRSPSDDGESVDVVCGGVAQPVTVSPDLPKTPTFKGKVDLAGIQCEFDVFSWNSFLALNHSLSGAFGDRDGDNTTTWEVWPNEGDIFLPGGAEPPAWKAGAPPPRTPVPPVCRGEGEQGDRVLVQIGKQPILVEADLEPFKSGPLIDAHGYYARFGITVNQPMYGYIRDNELYSRAGQKKFSAAGHAVEFPCGCEGDPSTKTETCPDDGQQGAVMVKAAWKVLDTGAGDDPSRFHTVDALVLTPAIGDQPKTCERQLVGLVGLHIGTKTQSDPQWVWSTFEQVDNVPTQGEEIPDGARFNFFIPGCDDCNTVNQTPPEPWNPHDQPVTANAGKSQVVREIPITEATRDLNSEVQGLLGGTVWRHYELISTQWPTEASTGADSRPSAANNWCNALNPTDESGAPAPAFLANTTLETYIQGTVPQASSSCINCHLNATMAAGQNNFSDFTYLLERAH